MAQKMNITVSDDLKAWLVEESKKTGIPQSTLVVIGFRSYVDQQRALDMSKKMDMMVQLAERMKIDESGK